MLILVVLLGISNIILIISIVSKTNNKVEEPNELKLKSKELEDENKELSNVKAKLEERVEYLIFELNKKIEEYKTILEEKKGEYNILKVELDKTKEDLKKYQIDYNKMESEKDNLNTRLKEQNDYIEELKKEMRTTFENISNDIIKRQKSDFTEQQKIVLQPFEKEIKEFKEKIEKNNKINIENKVSFEEQIKILSRNNDNLAKEAQDLTTALKGNKKLQGNWGEIQLENLLDITGLKEGIDYIRQETVVNEDGKIHRPDIVVNLPNGRKVIVDSKVSLNNYSEYISRDNEEEKKNYIKLYIDDLKSHIKELSSKEYYKDLKQQSISLDYVFMFVPLERAYIDAVDYDKSIYRFAFDNRIAIVTPSSLMPILKTIEYLWSIEKQNKNVEEIVKLAETIYKKIVLFKEDMEGIKKSLDKAQDLYEKAKNKIYYGRENVYRTAEKIKKLGVNTDKQLKLENLNLEDEKIEYEEEDETVEVEDNLEAKTENSD